MSPPRSRTGSLAADIVALTIAVVSVAVLVSSGSALVGVYAMIDAEEADRLIAYRQTVAESLDGRLLTMHRVVDSLTAALAARAVDDGTATRAIATAAQANAESFDLLAVVEESGTLVASVPMQREGIDGVVLERAKAAGRDACFFEQPARAGPGPERGLRLWVAESFSVGGRAYLLLARSRPGLRQALLDDADSKDAGRAAAVIGADGRVLVAGSDGPPLDLSIARFEPSALEAAGSARGIGNGSLGEMRGYWSRVSAAPELRWRVLIAEPSSAALYRTRAALLPASLTAALAALGALVASAVFARRLVRPLREFEQRARDVASGRLASPLESERRDEIGRLADAFDAILVRHNALRELSRLLARSTRLDESLRGTLAATARLLGPEVVPAVLLLGPDGSLELAAAPNGRGLPEGARICIGPESSWPAEALRSREPIAIGTDAVQAAGDPFAQVMFDSGVRSGLAVPLVASDEPIGILVALSTTGEEFSEAERETLWAFAAQAAMAIENSRLFEEERASRREAEALRMVAEELESPADLRAGLERVSDIAAGLLGASLRSLSLGGVVEAGLETLRGADFQSWDALYASLSGADAHAAVVVARDEPVPALLPQRHPPVMLIPLLQAGVRRGMLVLDRVGTKEDFGERQVMLATTVGREISLALENAFLLHEARSRATMLDTIFRISQAVSSSLQSTVVLNRVLDVVQKILSAEAVSLMTFEPVRKTIVTAMARGVPDREMLYFETVPGGDLPGAVFESGEAEVFPNLPGIDTPLARLAARAGFRSLLAVPLLARGRSTGVLSVYSSKADTFDKQDVELLQTFAVQAALAIDTAHLYGREHHVASVLQNSILPDRLPAVPGLDVATVYRPTGQEAEIGGDYYDLFLAPDGRVVLVIADVAGKGVVAATKTSMIRYSLRGMVAAGLCPAAALSELNRMVGETGDASEIVTIWVGFLDMQRRELVFASAGHPPALLRQPGNGAIERLGPTGTVLGAVPSTSYGEERTGVEEGATLVLYTDGVTEARSGGRFFGEGRLRRALRPGRTAEETLRRLMTSVDRFTGGDMRDDAAVLVARLTDRAGRADETV